MPLLMAEETILEHPVMNETTDPVAGRATARRNLPQPPLSLTKAAKAVGVSTSTLRRAIEDKKLKAVKSEEGHWRIKIDELMQYKANELDAPVDRGATDMSTRPVAYPATEAVAGAVDTGVAGLSHNVILREVHEAQVKALETENRLHKDTISDLRSDVESWKTQAKSWQNHADNNLRLLEDNRERLAEKELDIDLASAGQGSHVWRNISAAFLVVALVGTAIYFRADIAQQWAKITTASDSTAAAVESEIPQG